MTEVSAAFERARVPVFMNAAAGIARVDAGQLRQLLGAAVELRPTEPGLLRERVAEEVRRRTPIIGVAGGDGTLHTAASAIAGTDSALLCVPTGTLNNFARRIGIVSVDTAAAALREPHVETMALGTLEDDVFLNTVTFGEYSRTVRLRERLRRYVGKWPAAAVALLVTLLTLRRMRVTLHVGGRELERRTPFVWVGVGWGSFPRVYEALERRAHPDLEVAVLRSSSIAAAAAFMMRAAMHMLRESGPFRDPELEVIHTRQFVLDSKHRIDATADGEVLRLSAPVRGGVRDDALRVVTLRAAPEPYDAPA
jgi:diacylglycerol kinase family enzyme